MFFRMETIDAPIATDALYNLTEGDPAMEERMLLLFIKTIHHCVDQMNVALSNDPGTIWKSAIHELKGASKNIGAPRMVQLCRQFEHAVAYGDRKDALGEIVEECARIEIYIEDRLPP